MIVEGRHQRRPAAASARLLAIRGNGPLMKAIVANDVSRTRSQDVACGLQRTHGPNEGVASWIGSRTRVLMECQRQPAHHEEIAATMTVDTLIAEAPSTDFDNPDESAPSIESTPPASTSAPAAPTAEAPVEEQPKKSPPKKALGKKTKTLELTLTVTGTADGEWRAELRQGTTYLARDLAVAAAAVSRAAKELHEDLSTPIDEVIEEAREQQAARVATLEAELEAARKALADLD
jgi:Family of unknown function (DUF6319)